MVASLGRVIALAALGVLGACVVVDCIPLTNDPTPEMASECADAGPPADGKETVELRDDGGASFATYDGGVTLQLHHGPQGGQHVYVSIALYAKAPAKWTHALTFVENGQTVGSSAISVDACGPGWTITKDARVVLQTAGSHQGTLRVSSQQEGGSAGDALTFEVPVSIVDTP